VSHVCEAWCHMLCVNRPAMMSSQTATLSGFPSEDHLEVVAAQHNTNNVLANVMHIPLDCCHDDDSCVILRRVTTPQLLLFDEWQQMSHSLLHHPR